MRLVPEARESRPGLCGHRLLDPRMVLGPGDHEGAFDRYIPLGGGLAQASGDGETGASTVCTLPQCAGVGKQIGPGGRRGPGGMGRPHHL